MVTNKPMIGIAIVLFRSEDVIISCLNSLFRSERQSFRIVLVDNGSPDQSVDVVRNWAEQQKIESYAEYNLATMKDPAEQTEKLVIIRSTVNRGYAGGVNIALKVLDADPTTDAFWVLNPDCVVPVHTTGKFAEAITVRPDFGLLGGRILYEDNKTQIQSDGGKVNPWTGMCANINLGANDQTTAYPNSSDIEFMNGACMIASRKFLTDVGPMTEDYFLYYEEVDWSFRCGSMPLLYVEGAIIYHSVGTSIGSATLRRRPNPFANYFNFRNRIRFMRRFYPRHLLTAYVYSFLKATSLLLKGAFDEAEAGYRGLFELQPPKSVAEKLSPEAARIAFGKTDF